MIRVTVREPSAFVTNENPEHRNVDALQRGHGIVVPDQSDVVETRAAEPPGEEAGDLRSVEVALPPEQEPRSVVHRRLLDEV